MGNNEELLLDSPCENDIEPPVSMSHGVSMSVS